MWDVTTKSCCLLRKAATMHLAIWREAMRRDDLFSLTQNGVTLHLPGTAHHERVHWVVE